MKTAPVLLTLAAAAATGLINEQAPKPFTVAKADTQAPGSKTVQSPLAPQKAPKQSPRLDIDN